MHLGQFLSKNKIKVSFWKAGRWAVLGRAGNGLFSLFRRHVNKPKEFDQTGGQWRGENARSGRSFQRPTGL
jgi:hypothetical protein